MCDCGFKFSIREDCFCPRHIGAHKKLNMDEVRKHVDLDQAARWVFCLFETYFQAVQNVNIPVANKVVQLIKDIFYTDPIDALRVIITKYFFSAND